MPRFEKTRLHPATAVLILFGCYALAGLAYAAWARSADSVLIWAVLAAFAFAAALAWHWKTRRQRGAR